MKPSRDAVWLNTADIVQDLGKPWAEPLVGHAHHARRRTFRVNATTARTKKSNYRPVSLGHWRQIGQALHESLSWLMGSSKSRWDDGCRSAPTLFGCLWRNRLFHTPCMQVRKPIAPNADEGLKTLVLIHRISFKTKKKWFLWNYYQRFLEKDNKKWFELVMTLK